MQWEKIQSQICLKIFEKRIPSRPQLPNQSWQRGVWLDSLVSRFWFWQGVLRMILKLCFLVLLQFTVWSPPGKVWYNVKYSPEDWHELCSSSVMSHLSDSVEVFNVTDLFGYIFHLADGCIAVAAMYRADGATYVDVILLQIIAVG